MLIPLLLALQSSSLQPVVTTASRDARELARVPTAVSVVDSSAIRRTRAVHLGEALRMVPGVQAGSLYGTEDVRISIRGAGIRGSFGVRGIAVLLDGVPLTEPDGQSRLDALELVGIKRMEVLRGPAAALYGGAAGGGVLNLLSVSGTDAPGWGARYLVGSAGAVKGDATYGVVRGPFDAWVQGGYTRLGGYRQWSAGTNQRANVRLGWTGASGARVALDGTFANLDQRIPGTLLESEWTGDAAKADSLNVANRYGRREERWRVGSRVSLPVSGPLAGTLDAYAFASGRANEQPIFQFIKQIQTRQQLGLRHAMAGAIGAHVWRLAFAADGDRAAGPQTNWTNSGGAPVVSRNCVTDVAAGIASVPCVRQDATLSSLGLSSQGEVTRGPVTVTLGARWDDVRINVENRIRPALRIEKRFTQVSPKLAVAVQLRPALTTWASVSRGFDVPTATELTTSPDTARGFNDALGPATQWQQEIGLRGALGGRTTFEVVAFTADVRGEFVSRTVVIPGITQPRAYFENAARARRTGLEVAGQVVASEHLTVGATYAYSRFRFTSFRGVTTARTFLPETLDFAGRALPGIAPHRATAEVRWRPSARFGATLWSEWNSRIFVDNANTASGALYVRTSPASAAPNGRTIPFSALPSSALVHTTLTYALGGAELFGTMDNVLGTRWGSSASLNATNGRFYFPGPGRTLTLGVSLGALRP